jgi:hypothetical protein
MSVSTRPIAAPDAPTGAARLAMPELRPFRFCPSPRFALWLESSPKESPGDAMTEAVVTEAVAAETATTKAVEEKPEKLRKSSWWWPGVVATTLAGAAVMAFRGCWHARMSWPVGGHGCSYQVCLTCGAMRLFDEKTFSAFGPFRYDLDELIAWENSTKRKSCPVADRQRPVE